jgi:hypothetical protein
MTAPAITAIMTILPRDAVGGAAAVLDQVLMARSFSDDALESMDLQWQRESHKIESHSSNF